jgi:hypothetical protein
MSGFPLYDNLNKNIPKKDLTVKQKEEVVNIINNVEDDNTKELIYALIQFYYTNNSGSPKDSIPYSGDKCESKDKKLHNIAWSLSDLPIPLRQILYKFMSLHMKQKEEELKRDL